MTTLVQGPTIPAGESLSDAINVVDAEVIVLFMPTDWTPANLSFQISLDGGVTFANAYEFGGEVITTVVPGSVVAIPVQWSRLTGQLRLRSGRHERPVAQEAERIFAVGVNLPPVKAA